jgi:hypothetical protein
MRYVVTLRRGEHYQQWEGNYGCIPDAIFGVLLKEASQVMRDEPIGGNTIPLEVSCVRGGTIPRLSRGARRVA